MESELVSLKVDPAMVSSVLEKQIQAAIVRQLGNQDELIAQAVSKALSVKVDQRGSATSRYESDKKYDFLEVLTTNSIHEAAQVALREWLDKNSGKVREAVLAELDTPGRKESIAKAYADAIESSLKCSWDMKCNIEFKRSE